MNGLMMGSLFRNFQSVFPTLFAIIAVIGCSGIAQKTDPSFLPARNFVLNENMIEELAVGNLDHACDYSEVLPQLLEQIGPDANIYPSENYYYFLFNRYGSLFSGSIRLSSDRRDSGELDYVCYESNRPWMPTGNRIYVYKRLSLDDGVSVDKLSERSYLVRYGEVQTRFALQKLDQTSPGSPLLPSETRIGRMQDDSGSIFELIYNEKLNDFYFLLDLKKGIPDKFVKTAPNTVISRRTGFVYYQGPDEGRYVLVAVNQQETRLNSPYDGPFDQLPENDYLEIGFWDYVYKTNPEMIGKHTPGGTINDEGMIFSLVPYRHYDQVDELTFIEACADSTNFEIDRINCMIWGR